MSVLVWFAGRVHCRARWCADTSFWARIVLVFLVLVLVFTAVRDRVRFRVFGQGLRLSSWFGARVHCRARW